MFKIKLIFWLIKFVFGIALVGIAVWYMSNAMGGTSISYVKVSTFADAMGVSGGDLTTANGCFMCKYVSEIFSVLSTAAENMWTKIIAKLWLVMAFGFGLYVVISAIQHILESMKQATKLDSNEKKIEIKSWLDKLWKNGARVIVVGILLGAIGAGGTQSLKVIANVTATPILYLGAELGAAATQLNTVATCGGEDSSEIFSTENAVLDPVFKPFLCVVANVNGIVMAGAAGGFALMNYSYLGMGGGVLSWVAGLGLVLMFMYLGFNLFFQILSIMFKLIFVILFLPLILAASAFEKMWSKAAGLLKKSIDMLVSAAIKTLAVTLKTVILFGIVGYVSDMYLPGPVDGFTSVLPPLAGLAPNNMDSRNMSIMNVFKTCEERASASSDFKETYLECFEQERETVEAAYPDAFDFMDIPFEFVLMMMFVFFLYLLAVEPKVDKLLPDGNAKPDARDPLDFSAMIKGYGKMGVSGVSGIYNTVKNVFLEGAK